MWWVKDHPDHSRGGFQNRDVGRTNFNDDYGPDHGVDYARFSDTPDPAKDLSIKESILNSITNISSYADLNIVVKNGFVFLKGVARDQHARELLTEISSAQENVRDVINEIKVSSEH